MSAGRTGIRAGVGVARLTAAGNAVWCDDGPDFIFNTLTVEGPRQALHEFLGAASGPGFIDWRPEWYGVYENIYFTLMRPSMPTVQAADKLAKKFRDIAWWAHERGRVVAEIDSHRQPLDLNALFPIPKRVLRKGFAEGGQEWMWANWGVRWPIRRVTFAMEQQRVGRTKLKPVAVFRFLSEDWSPWIALARMRERWPGLIFVMKAAYLQEVCKGKTEGGCVNAPESPGFTGLKSALRDPDL
jgi:hypothetical protein